MSASTTLITDSTTMITNGPSNQTALNAASGTFTPSPTYVQAGAPVDYIGMLQEYKDTLKSIKQLLLNLEGVTDAADPNLTTIQNDLLTFS